MLVITVILLPLLSTKAEECNTNAKCLTCPPEAPFTCTTCEKGYFLARGGAYYSCKQCAAECIECEDWYTCTICEAGRHGSECQNVCSTGCVNSTCDQYLGHCICKENYKGTKCDQCIDGKYSYASNRCELRCPKTCKSCISSTNCTLCNTGYYGSMCENNCPKGCFLSVCSKNNGTCYGNKCKPDFDGLNCDKCSTGRYGKDCALVCNKNCVSCHLETSCDVCIEGHWGPKCEIMCPHGCQEGKCLKLSGICQHDKCRPGFYGDRCEYCITGKRGFNCNINSTYENYLSTAVHLHMSVFVIGLPFLRITGTM